MGDPLRTNGPTNEPRDDDGPLRVASNDLQRRVDAARFTVSLPNERVFAEVVGLRRVSVWLAHGHYEQVTSTKLESELANLARLLFARGLREQRDAFKEVTGRTADTNRIRIGRRDRAYADRLENLQAVGRSDDGSVEVSALGQQHFSVTIAPGTLQRVPQAAFEAGCGQAADRLLADTEVQAARAKVEVFEPVPGFRYPD